MRRLIDLSHAVEHGMVTYPGLPGPVISDYLSREASKDRYAQGTTFHIGKIEMVGNTGTYIDAPFHRYEGEKDLGAPAEQVADLKDHPRDCAAGHRPELFAGADVRKGGANHGLGALGYGGVLPRPSFLTAEAAEWLKAAGPALVGIDSRTSTTPLSERPSTDPAAAGILIVEHLRARAASRLGFPVSCGPGEGAGAAFPVRAYAVVEA